MRWLFRFYKKKKRGSGAVAKRRLKTLLISDRADCSADFISGIKGDIGLTLSKYMEIDTDHMEVNILQQDNGLPRECSMVLVARIPFKEINKVIC
ncbi:MAG: cell division topological specificity factor MinE [Clostridia bacterium]|nr:cell division topological specificity factor MinE [Lachnospiraceae bacterium]NCC00646.1 cell division topological specificity factor MinE [Clostridia bacterium]NCD02658.1 cell division topological specificity factor MinE [Clostridia bacterium]